MWVWWVLGGLIAWLLVALLVGIALGRGVRLADRREADAILPGADLAALVAMEDEAQLAAGRSQRRRLPLPTIGVALALVGVAFETSGFLLRLDGSTSRALSMDAPYSLPRLYVALLFATAALLAVAGASAIPGRRTWWTAVGLVAGVVSAVKAGSTVHADALRWLSESIGTPSATLVSVVLAVSVVGALWVLSRGERRDRARVLGSLAGYAVAAVGLSAVSSVVAGAYGGGSSWAAGAAFIEESGEALGGVALLVAVLAGVAPRLVLPATWPLRREVDAQTLDLPERLPARLAPRDSTR